MNIIIVPLASLLPSENLKCNINSSNTFSYYSTKFDHSNDILSTKIKKTSFNFTKIYFEYKLHTYTYYLNVLFLIIINLYIIGQ